MRRNQTRLLILACVKSWILESKFGPIYMAASACSSQPRTGWHA